MRLRILLRRGKAPRQDIGCVSVECGDEEGRCRGLSVLGVLCGCGGDERRGTVVLRVYVSREE